MFMDWTTILQNWLKVYGLNKIVTGSQSGLLSTANIAMVRIWAGRLTKMSVRF